MRVRHFKTAAALRTWLEANHADRPELWIGFYNTASGLGGLTYPEAVDVALCFGWIDGVRRKVDERSYTNRFTPRKPGSRWSAINVKRLAGLRARGLVAAAGVRAFEAWNGKKAPYSFEQPPIALSPEFIGQFKKDARAWTYFSSAPPGYRRVLSFWVMSAKKDETRRRRLQLLMASSHAQRRHL